jgi:MYXO-CTERM domain-containing protein
MDSGTKPALFGGMRLGTVLTVVGAMLLRVGSSAACPAPGWELGPVGPADQASGVALNAPISIGFEVVPLAEDTYAFNDLENATLSLVEVATATVLETTPRRLASDNYFSVFLPKTKLKPHTLYRAESSLGASWDFTTGEDERAVLRLEGPIEVSYEAGSDPRVECQNFPGSCGGPCTEVGRNDVTKARLTLPAVFDGFSDAHLRAYVSISDQAAAPGDTPRDFYTPITQGLAGEALLTMPMRADRKPYRACFTFTATDARGDSVKSAQFCSSEDVPVPPEAKEPEPEPEPQPEPEPEPQPEPGQEQRPIEPVDPALADPMPEDAAATGSADEPAGEHQSSGCSVTGPERGASSALAGLLGLAALSRRRKPKNAT